MTVSETGQELLISNAAIPGESLVDMALVLRIGEKEFMLDGTANSSGIKVEYAQLWKEAADLGRVGSTLEALGAALGLDDLEQRFTSFINGLPGFLKNVVAAFANAHIIITDLSINTQEGKGYIIGAGLLFTGLPRVQVGSIRLFAFLVKYNYTGAQTIHEQLPYGLASASSTDVSLVLQIGQKEFVLDGTSSAAGLSVNFSCPLHEAIDLGMVKDALSGIGKVLLGDTEGEKFYQNVSEFINNLPGLLSEIINAFLGAHVVITKLKADVSPDNQVSFTLGIGLLFTQSPPRIGGIELLSFLFEYTHLSHSEYIIRAQPQSQSLTDE
jgi:hypothetical protein